MYTYKHQISEVQSNKFKAQLLTEEYLTKSEAEPAIKIESRMARRGGHSYSLSTPAAIRL